MSSEFHFLISKWLNVKGIKVIPRLLPFYFRKWSTLLQDNLTFGIFHRLIVRTEAWNLPEWLVVLGTEGSSVLNQSNFLASLPPSSSESCCAMNKRVITFAIVFVTRQKKDISFEDLKPCRTMALYTFPVESNSSDCKWLYVDVVNFYISPCGSKHLPRQKLKLRLQYVQCAVLFKFFSTLSLQPCCSFCFTAACLQIKKNNC